MREDIVNVFYIYEVFPLSSHYEMSPLVLFETGAARCPVVATNVGSVPEIIKHNENGLLVEYGDTRGFADAIKQVLTDPQLAERLAHNLRLDMERKYSYDTIACKKLNVYEELLHE